MTYSLAVSCWCIVHDADGYAVREVPIGEFGEGLIIAAHPDRLSAEQGLERLEMMRKAIEPQLQASLAHEAAVRNKLYMAVLTAAMPRSDNPLLQGKSPGGRTL